MGEIVNEKGRELRRRGRPGEEGYDAIGIVVVDCVNDGSPVSLVSDPRAPGLRDPFHYDAMIRRIVHQHDTLFATL